MTVQSTKFDNNLTNDVIEDDDGNIYDKNHNVDVDIGGNINNNEYMTAKQIMTLYQLITKIIY